MKLGLTIAAFSLLTVCALAQQVSDRATLMGILSSSSTDDFEKYDVGFGDAVTTGVSSLDSSTIVDGQGPGLVNPGATYSGGPIQWNGDTYFSLDTKTILINGSTGEIDIDYGVFVQAVGIDTKGFSGFPWTGSMDVYNGATLIDSVALSIVGGGTETAFAGYRNDAGITRVVIHSTAYTWSPIIDNSTYGVTAVPEPVSTLALAGGLVAFLRKRRR